MNGPIRSLIIKEYHEQKWRCASLCAIGLAVVVFTMLYEPEMVLGSGITVIFFQAHIGAIFIAMGGAAGERSSRTLELLRALPVKMPRIAAVKLALGAATCLVPILAVLLVIGVWLAVAHLLAATGNEYFAKLLNSNVGMYTDIDEFFKASVAGTATCLSVYLWTVAIGINRRSELAVGLLGIVMLVGWFLVIVFTERVFHEAMNFSQIESGDFNPFAYLISLVEGLGPFGAITPQYGLTTTVFKSIVQLAGGCGLFVWSVRCYGRVGLHDNASPSGDIVYFESEPIGRPRRSPIAAVIWKQWRDAAPMAAVALGVIALFVGLSVMDTPHRYTGDGWPVRIGFLVKDVSRATGMFLALVVGVGTFVGDYKPGALTFWRSRPISPRLWFWSKYLTGFIIVELTAIAPWLIAQVATGWHDLWAGPGYLGTVTLLYFLVYTVAVWLACLIRHTVYAAIVATAVVMFILVPPMLARGWWMLSIVRVAEDMRNAHTARAMIGTFIPFFVFMVACTGISLWLATRAARRDMGFVFER